MGRGHRCWRCRLDDAIDDALAGPDGQIPVQLLPLADAVRSMPRPNSGWVWLRNPNVRALLARLATGELALTHDAIDLLPRSTTVEYVRGLLTNSELLPPRDHYLAAFQRWLDTTLERVDDLEQRRLIDRYARWQLMRQLRSNSHTAPVSQGSFFSAKQSTTIAIALLAWLHEHGTTLPEVTQHHLDAWFAEGPTTRQHAVRFLHWAIKHRLVRGVTATRTATGSTTAITQDQRTAQLRRVLLDDTLVPSHRLLAVLVLLFGQPLSRTVRLRIDDVVLDGPRTLLRLGDDPVEVPEPAATLLRTYLADSRYRRNTAAHTTSADRWLLPGLMPGRAMHVNHATKALRDLGIPPRAARTATWLHLIRAAPPAVLADALGITPETAMRHATRAGADYLTYPTRKRLTTTRAR